MTLNKTLLLLTCLLLPASAEAGLSQDQLQSLLAQANDAFKRANESIDDAERESLHEKAILSFERIINQGRIKNAKLYYNLANAYLLKEDVGRAILNYRRAETLDPADPKIKKNLDFARSHRIDKVKVKTEKRVLQTLFFWHYDFSLSAKFTIACLSFAALCVALTVTLWTRRMPILTVITVIAAVFTVAFFTSVVVEAGQQARTKAGVITAREVVAHQAD
ncbi:MAG: hypothetical protein ACYS29_10245, partial [Planctomycetota bacterium]